MFEQKIIRYILLVWVCMYWCVYAGMYEEQKPQVKSESILRSVSTLELNKVEIKRPIQLSSRGAVRDSERERTVRAIDMFLKNKLANKGSVIYDKCKKQDPEVSARLMTAIMLLEVGPDCDSKVLNNADNVGGLNWFKDCGYPKYGRWYIDFSKHGGVDKSIEMKAEVLSRYIREGRNDIISIGLKYAPPDDSRNGIGGMDNTKWADNVKTYFDMITDEYEKLH